MDYWPIQHGSLISSILAGFPRSPVDASPGLQTTYVKMPCVEEHPIVPNTPISNIRYRRAVRVWMSGRTSGRSRVLSIRAASARLPVEPVHPRHSPARLPPPAAAASCCGSRCRRFRGGAEICHGHKTLMKPRVSGRSSSVTGGSPACADVEPSFCAASRLRTFNAARDFLCRDGQYRVPCVPCPARPAGNLDLLYINDLVFFFVHTTSICVHTPETPCP